MKNFTLFKNYLFNTLVFAILAIGFSACSSSKQAYNDDDGIYGATEKKQEVVMVRDTQTDYYQNYFSGEKNNNEEINFRR